MLVYAHKLTPRLEYVCGFIFRQYLGIDYILTTDLKHFAESNDAQINYSESAYTRCRYNIVPVPLLFENNIVTQPIEVFEQDGYKAFYRSPDSTISFDIFAAIFYLLSRYEEYLPHDADQYGRYAHQNSLASKKDFLQQPLVNIWLNTFAESLFQVYPELKFAKRAFTFLPTYDIDIAWAYKNKGMWRDLGGMLIKPSLARVNVYLGKEKDPYDCYDFLDRLHDDLNLNPLYFFLVASNPGRYDKNNTTSGALKYLIKHHAEKYTIGMHPSWQSHEERECLRAEKKYLEEQTGKAVTSSRQHYVKFHLPETYRILLDHGIKDDYSMGYGTVNGFRASIASAFYWYDLQAEKQTDLMIHPFCFMDATNAFQTKRSAEETFADLLYYYSVCKDVDGKLITIFHNNILGGEGAFVDWPEMYVRFLSVVAGNQP